MNEMGLVICLFFLFIFSLSTSILFVKINAETEEDDLLLKIFSNKRFKGKEK